MLKQIPWRLVMKKFVFCSDERGCEAISQSMASLRIVYPAADDAKIVEMALSRMETQVAHVPPEIIGEIPLPKNLKELFG